MVKEFMTKVLITGGAGYIGAQTTFSFLDEGHEVAVVDNYSAGVRVPFPAKVKFYEGNCADTAFMDKTLASFRPEAVLHFAGSIIVPESVSHPRKYYENNTFASLRLIEACLRAGVEFFVFSSTAAVYGIPDGGVALEDGIATPINPYGHSKLMIEQMLADISAAENLCYAALRYFNVAGADPEGRTGQSSPQSTHLVKVACEVAAGVRDKIEIFGTDYDTPDGTCVRDYIHVWDLAKAHIAALRFIQQEKRNGLFNCGNGAGYSVREVISAVEEVSGTALTQVEGPRRAGDPPQLIADPSRLLNSTSWKPQWTKMTDIIRHALAWEEQLKKQ